MDFLPLFLIFGQKHSIFIIKDEVSCRFLEILSIRLKEVPSISGLLSFFFFLNHEVVSNFVKCFFCIN